MNKEYEDPKMYKVEDIQRILGVGKARAYSIMRSRCFPAMRIGKTYVVTEKNFNEWLQNSTGKQILL